MIAAITRSYTFDSAHRLKDYGGKCRGLHGHTYRVEVELCGNVNDAGLVMDFGDLDQVMQAIIEPLDHATILQDGDSLIPVLQQVSDVGKLVQTPWPPTAENLAGFILGGLQRLVERERYYVSEVRVWETPRSWASVRNQQGCGS